jgi:hypothetical protein
MRRITTPEQKVAVKLVDLLSDIRLDIERIGEVLGEISPTVILNRILYMAEIAKEIKDDQHPRL